MSREAFERIVRGYEEYDPQRMYEDVVCLWEVSKRLNGRYTIRQKDDQACDKFDCRTRKHHDSFELSVESGPCDSELSAELLDGNLEGELVAAYKDADLSQRGGLSGAFKWGTNAGGVLVGRTFGMINAGTHYEPINQCEECYQPYHSEGWIRAAIVEGEHEGCRVNGSVAYQFDPGGEGGVIVGNFEGVLICQCEG